MFRKMIPTATSTLSAMMEISQISLMTAREIGKIEGKNVIGSEAALVEVIVRGSKAILQAMPYLQFEDDELEDEELELDEEDELLLELDEDEDDEDDDEDELYSPVGTVKLAVHLAIPFDHLNSSSQPLK